MIEPVGYHQRNPTGSTTGGPYFRRHSAHRPQPEQRLFFKQGSPEFESRGIGAHRSPSRQGAPVFAGDLCLQSTIVEGYNGMRIFQAEIFGRVVP